MQKKKPTIWLLHFLLSFYLFLNKKNPHKAETIGPAMQKATVIGTNVDCLLTIQTIKNMIPTMVAMIPKIKPQISLIVKSVLATLVNVLSSIISSPGKDQIILC